MHSLREFFPAVSDQSGQSGQQNLQPASPMSRRGFLRSAAVSGATLAVAPALFTTQASGQASAQAAASAAKADFVSTSRAAAAKTPITVTRLYDNLFLLQGAGGNMAVQTGADGKVLIDSSYMTAAPLILAKLDELSKDPAHLLINSHWHVDHVDGNQPMHAAGFAILAHEKTRERLSTPQTMKILDISLPAYPAAAWPVTTFHESLTLWRNGDQLDLAHYAPAHTDTDIYVHFRKANVLHVADIWFNGFYPLIDESSGGKIDGMIAASAQALTLADSETKIIPGHGPLGNKAQLADYHQMLVEARERVAAIKRTGATEKETVARKPTAALDAKWGKGFMSPEVFTGLVYRTLPA